MRRPDEAAVVVASLVEQIGWAPTPSSRSCRAIAFSRQARSSVAPRREADLTTKLRMLAIESARVAKVQMPDLFERS